MRRPWAAAVLTLCLLGACVGGGDPANRSTPPPVDPRGQGENSLIVGHRLMEAGEYELALKAYLRAAAEEGPDADVLSGIGSANLKLGRLGQAEDVLRRAIKLDPTFVPALNNLGVVLMERGKTGEARRVFEQAFAYDSGASDAIRENLRLAIARTEQNVYVDPSEANRFSLVRQGQGEYLLLTDL
jgi:tetratricopeptide (TPR) repeat protein